MAASLAVRISLEWSFRSLSARPWWASSVEPLGIILHATYSGGCVSRTQTQMWRGMVDGSLPVHCCPPSWPA